ASQDEIRTQKDRPSAVLLLARISPHPSQFHKRKRGRCSSAQPRRRHPKRLARCTGPGQPARRRAQPALPLSDDVAGNSSMQRPQAPHSHKPLNRAERSSLRQAPTLMSPPRKLAGEPSHVAFAQFDLELLHEPSPDNASSFPQPRRNLAARGLI